MAEGNEQQGKRKYVPPKITIISLRPEEAVLGNCKSTSGLSGPSNSGTGCALPTACPVVGS
jgi:hypothetical protein